MPTKNMNEKVFLNKNTGQMVTDDDGSWPYMVDNAEEAATFWNANCDAKAGFLRDCNNLHYWATAAMRKLLSTPFDEPEPKVITHGRAVDMTRPIANTQTWDGDDNEPTYS